MDTQASVLQTTDFGTEHDIRIMLQDAVRRMCAVLLVGMLVIPAVVLVPFLQWGLAAWHFAVRRDLAAARRADGLPAQTERALRTLYRRILQGPARGR